MIGDVEDDRARFEQREIAFLIGRNAAKRIAGAVFGFLERFHRDEADIVWLSHLLKCPAHTHVARHPFALIGRIFENGNGGFHDESPDQIS